MTVILIIFGLGVVIFFHEFGHFVIAKMFKLKVLQFSFGLGKEIVGVTYKDTRYSVCIFPFGGAVKIKGENLEEENYDKDSFFGTKWYKRLLIVFAGPFMNYVLAFLLFLFLSIFYGVAEISNEPIVGNVVPNFPAEKVGIQPKDKILKINDIEIKTWSDMAQIIHSSAEKKINVLLQREEKIIKLEIVPMKDPSSGVGIIGISPGYVTKKVSFYESVKISLFQPVIISIVSVRYLIEKIVKLQKPEVAGPIGIVQVMAKAAKSGIEQFVYTIALISSAVGLFNLFPIPVLDGGHIMFSLAEGVLSRKPTKKVYEIANYIGLVFILALFMFATYSDILRNIQGFKK
jgi:regulator of sigma E protease